MSDPQIAVRNGRKQHFFQTPNVVVDHYLARIGPTVFAVHAVLERHAGWDSGEAYVSVKKICKLVGISDTTVWRCLKTLAAHKLIAITDRRRQNMTNLYTLLDLPEEAVDHISPMKGGARDHISPMKGAPPFTGEMLNKTSRMNEKDSSPNSNHSGHSDRPTESEKRTVGRRKHREADEEEQVAEGLLTQALGKIDPYLARGILKDCHEENPEASSEVFLVKLSIVLTEGNWKGKRNPAGWIRTTMRELVRRDRLVSWEENAAKGLQAIRN